MEDPGLELAGVECASLLVCALNILQRGEVMSGDAYEMYRKAKAYVEAVDAAAPEIGQRR